MGLRLSCTNPSIYPSDADHPNASLSDNKSPEKEKVADKVKDQRSFHFDGPGYSTDSDIDEYSDLEEDEGIRTDLPMTQMCRCNVPCVLQSGVVKTLSSIAIVCTPLEIRWDTQPISYI